MFNWIPRWHPFVWMAVVIVVWAVVKNPVGMGGRGHDIIHFIGYAAGQITIFFESI